jgi:hypothetical protein
MKKRILGIALILILIPAFGPVSPAFAQISYHVSDTGPHNGFVGASIMETYNFQIVNDRNEVWSFRFPADAADAPSSYLTASQSKEADGVKEIAFRWSYLSQLRLMTDGTLFSGDEIVTTGVSSIVGDVATGADTGILYVSDKGELCLWRTGGVDVIDTNVRRGVIDTQHPLKAWYIKNDGGLWELIFENGRPANKMLFLEDVAWFAFYNTYYAIREDGALWGWGPTDQGELGISEDVHPFQRSLRVIAGFGSEEDLLKAAAELPKYDYRVDEPVKIMDDVKRLFRDDDGIHALTTAGKVESWGGNTYYEFDPSIVEHKLRPEKQWLSGVELLYDAYSPVRIVQYTDGRLELTQKSGENILYAGHMHTTVDYTFAPDMSLLGYGNPNVPSAAPTTPASPAASAVNAKPTASTVLVNGANVSFDAYSIGGNNYFKLRDLAYVLNGSEKQFDVDWYGAGYAIFLTKNKAYIAVGGEMTGKGAGDKTATPTTAKVLLNGKEVAFTAYNIDGNNYFKLRDIGAAFDFGVDWDGAKNTIVIDTGNSYTPE